MGYLWLGSKPKWRLMLDSSAEVCNGVLELYLEGAADDGEDYNCEDGDDDTRR